MITKALVKSPVKQLLNCFLFMPGLLKRGRARKGKAQTLINAEVWASLRPVCMGVSVNTHTHISLGRDCIPKRRTVFRGAQGKEIEREVRVSRPEKQP